MLLANVIGPDTAIVLIVLVLMGLWLWGMVDAISRPSDAFLRARSNKALWIVLMIVFGWLGALIYLLAVRGRVHRAAAGPTLGAAPPAVGPPAGWYDDPYRRHAHRWWDGRGWTDQVRSGDTVSSDPAPGTLIRYLGSDATSQGRVGGVS